MAHPTLRAVTATGIDTNGAFVVGFDANDKGALVRDPSIHNGDDTESLLVSLDGGTTYHVVVPPFGNFPLPQGTYQLGGTAATALKWKASANTISTATLLWLGYLAPVAVA